MFIGEVFGACFSSENGLATSKQPNGYLINCFINLMHPRPEWPLINSDLQRLSVKNKNDGDYKNDKRYTIYDEGLKICSFYSQNYNGIFIDTLGPHTLRQL
jgi:hypothetical protein